MTYRDLTDTLSVGRSTEVRITIPEGATIADIDAILTRQGLIEGGEFRRCTVNCDFDLPYDSLEGFLYPSTYYENPDKFTVRDFITRLHNTLKTQIKPLQDEIDQSERTFEQIMIVASMVEREANLIEEMPIIAEIIWKRLDESIILGIDATTRYDLGDWKRPLTTADFQVDSPYNTRNRLGLPPTAISNPSLDAITAAVRPATTDYYYYLHDPRGQIHYGQTLADHQANKRKYLQ